MAKRKYGRRQVSTKSTEVIDETKFDYRQIWDHLYALNEKSNWEAATNEQEDDSDLMLFYDIIVEKNELEVLQATGRNLGEKWSEENQEQLMEMYNTIREKSGLSDLELEEAEFYVKRLSRYDAYVENILTISEDIVEGNQRDEPLLPKQLGESIMEYAIVIAEDIAQFNKDMKDMSVMFNEKTGQWTVVKNKVDKSLNKSTDALKEGTGLFEKIGNGAGKTAEVVGDAASGAFGFLKKKLMGNKKQAEKGRFDEHFDKIAELLVVFGEIQEDLKDREHEMRDLVERGFKPIQEKAIILGQEQDKLILRYDEYIGALEEARRVYEETILPNVEANAEKGAIYKESQVHLARHFTQIKERINQLTEDKMQMKTQVIVSSGHIKNIEVQLQRANRILNEKIPRYNHMMEGMILQVDDLKNKRVMADGIEFDEKITELFVNLVKAADSLSVDMDEAIQDPVHIERALEEVAEVQRNQAQRALEGAKKLDERKRTLESAEQKADQLGEEAANIRKLEGVETGKRSSKAAPKKAASNDDKKENGEPSLADKFADKQAKGDKPAEETAEEPKGDSLDSLKERSKKGPAAPKK